jgi:hypothetical protein
MNINFDTPTQFGHHRDGWGAATRVLSKIHDPNGVKLYDWADRIFKNQAPIDHPWCGFLHNVLTYPDKEYPEKYREKIYPLSELVEKEFFLKSLEKCKGLYTLSKHTANFLKRKVNCPITSFTHPVRQPSETFSFDKFMNSNKKVVTAGQWLRRYHSLVEIRSNFEKIILKLNDFEHDYEEAQRYAGDKQFDVTIMKYLPHLEYDNMLTESIIFLDLYDCAACNTILECIIRNTPILINVLPGIVEYLGPDYPFYYTSFEEASAKLADTSLIKEVHEYLKNLDKKRFAPSYFLQEFVLKS